MKRGDYMTNKKKTVIPKEIFNVPQKIITTKEALKDVIPIKWDNVKKERKNNNNQAVNLVNNKVN